MKTPIHVWPWTAGPESPLRLAERLAARKIRAAVLARMQQRVVSGELPLDRALNLADMEFNATRLANRRLLCRSFEDVIRVLEEQAPQDPQLQMARRAHYMASRA